MFYNFILIVLIISGFSGISSFDMGAKNLDNYGPFVAEYSNLEACKGPKAKDLTSNNVTLEFNGTDYLMYCQMNYFEQQLFAEVKVKVFAIKNNRTNLLWNYRMDKPCHHFFIAAVLQPYLNVSNCMVKKGSYKMEINLTELNKKFFGEAFFYGEYQIKTIVLSTKGNIMCIVMKITFVKKK